MSHSAWGPQVILDTMFSELWQYIHFPLIMTVTLSSAARQACLLDLSSLSIKFYFITASHMHLICSLLYVSAAMENLFDLDEAIRERIEV